MENQHHPIDPLSVAAKLRAMRNFELPELQAEIAEEPRLEELLWVIVWVSNPRNYPGGLQRFCSDLVAECSDLIGTPTMLKATAGERYSEKEGVAIYNELPMHITGGCDSAADFGRLLCDAVITEDWTDIPASKDSAPRDFARTTNPDQLRNRLIREAEYELPLFFRHLCEIPQVRFMKGREYGCSLPLYWPNVCRDALEWLDRRAERIINSIASTTVTRDVIKWIRRARKMESPVWLTGSCRFGKTEAIRALAMAEPGRYRLVETPDDSSMLSLCRAVADTLGIECNGGTALKLRGLIIEVLDRSRVTLLFDEAHFLMPQKVSRFTRPQRLDFVRRVIIDRGLPVAFVSTPQSYRESRNKLEKATGYSIGQWDGRLLREQPVELPEEITDEEAIAVAAVHLPGYSRTFHEAIAHRVMASRGSSIYAQTAKLCKMAFVLADEKGRERLRFEDLEEAAAIILPSIPKEPVPATDSKPQRAKSTASTTFPGRKVPGRLLSVRPSTSAIPEQVT